MKINKHFFVLILLPLIFACFFSCKKSDKTQIQSELISVQTETAQNQPSEQELLLQQQQEQQDFKNAIHTFVQEMPVKERISQMFLITIGGTSFSNDYYDATNFVAPGGYLLFAYNFTDKAADAINFTSSINNWYLQNDFVPPYFSVDQEGGLVNRLKTVASPLPSQFSVAKFLTQSQAKELYAFAGKQIAALGINVNLAPVVEILTDENRAFLDTRSFGEIGAVKQYSEVFIQSMLEANVYPVIKHFPGNNSDDPHLGLPVINVQDLYTDSNFNKNFVDPFKSISQKDKVGILVAHSVLSGIAEPSCLNYDVVSQFLKKDLGFSGLVFSDDLLMKALLNNGFPPDKALSMAIQAGIDVLMVSQKEYLHLVEALIPLVEENVNMLNEVNDSVCKLVEFKIQQGLLEYSDGVVSIPKPKTESELHSFNEKRLQDFNSAKEAGQIFYQTYWGK